MSADLLMALLFIFGLVLLWFGAKQMIRGAASLAVKSGVRPLVVGLTVVAFGTSAPELIVSLIAAITNSPDVAIGNVVGSNIANIGLILGLTGLILPIASDRSFLKMDMPFVFAAMAVLYAVSLDGVISRPDAIALLLGLVVFNLMIWRTAGSRGGPREVKQASQDISRLKAALLTAAGLAGLSAGARMMVYSAVEIARSMGISELVIGATIVAMGTSLPELAASLAAVIQKHPDIGLGNVIGSNIFNICSILGIAPLIRPLAVDRRLLCYDYPLMAGFALMLLFMLMKKRNRITRPESFILLAGYLAFLVWSFSTS